MDPLKALPVHSTQVPLSMGPSVRSAESPGEKNQPAEEERFVSSDMAQMIEDISRVDPTYMKSAAAGVPTPARSKEEPFMGTDMAQMVEDISRYEESIAKSPEDSTIVLSFGGSRSAPVTLTQIDSTSNAIPSAVQKGHKGKHHHHLSHILTAAHFGIEGAETLQAAESSLIAVSETASHTSSAASAGAEGASHLSEAGETVGHAVSGVMVAGAIGSGIVAVGMTALGARNLHKGIKHGDNEMILEGSGETILGAKSAASALTMAGHGAKEGILASVAHGAHTLLVPLGLAHGAIDLTLGIKKIHDGIRHHNKGEIIEGALEVGQGTAIGTAAVVGGLPAILIAAAFLGSKVLIHHLNGKSPNHH
jgi:hypothetical protein